MDKFIISIRTFENILENLVKLEEEHDLILDQYAGFPRERAGISQLVERYVKGIEHFLQAVDKVDTQSSGLPLVTLGCEVEVEELSTQIRRKIRLVSATDEIKDGDISIFSAQGNALLLKKTGSIVELELPAGKAKYRITGIKALI
ncbi:MAG: transcription elongation factor GreA [Firmicutes bacterium ADurb.Bin456]|nr:MAG: transcription elongation factor GreA [Firmicutes bacterium ADurb.Bin456]